MSFQLESFNCPNCDYFIYAGTALPGEAECYECGAVWRVDSPAFTLLRKVSPTQAEQEKADLQRRDKELQLKAESNHTTCHVCGRWTTFHITTEYGQFHLCEDHHTKWRAEGRPKLTEWMK